MNALEAAQRIGRCFDEDGIPYAVGGALALGVWAVPRATKDVDISAFVTDSDLPRVFDSLERAGVMVDRSTSVADVARIGLFKGRLGRIIIDVFVSQHPQYAAMQRRTIRVTDAAGVSTAFLSPEDLAIHKLVFGRPKDIADLEGLFARRTDLDVAYVRHWLRQMVAPGDQRLAVLDDLQRRFLRS
jgi:hypothetical protein